MKVILNNGTELDAFAINGKYQVMSGQTEFNGQIRYYQGANRDTLEFQFLAENVTLDQIDQEFTAENTKKITLQIPVYENGNPLLDGEGNQVVANFEKENYFMRMSLSKSPVQIEPETGSTPPVYVEMISVVMAQRTYTELMQDSVQETVDILVLEALGV